jgi:hypothetical protein
VPFGSNTAETAADWLVASPDRTAEIDRTCWSEALASEGGTVFRQEPGCNLRTSAG